MSLNSAWRWPFYCSKSQWDLLRNVSPSEIYSVTHWQWTWKCEGTCLRKECKAFSKEAWRLHSPHYFWRLNPVGSTCLPPSLHTDHSSGLWNFQAPNWKLKVFRSTEQLCQVKWLLFQLCNCNSQGTYWVIDRLYWQKKHKKLLKQKSSFQPLISDLSEWLLWLIPLLSPATSSWAGGSCWEWLKVCRTGKACPCAQQAPLVQKSH